MSPHVPEGVSPLPWLVERSQVRGSRGELLGYLVTAPGETSPEAEVRRNEANARYIVKAANAFQRLVAALENLAYAMSVAHVQTAQDEARALLRELEESR